MKHMAACLVVLLGVRVLTVATGQEVEEVLTNADVVTLTEAGLPAAVIVAKIAVTRTAFNTTVEQIVVLSRAEVDPEVIETMIRASETPEPPRLGARAESIEFGDDASAWARDGECDDPRFEGDGMASTLSDADRGHDATDCRQLFKSGRIRLHGCRCG